MTQVHNIIVKRAKEIENNESITYTDAVFKAADNFSSHFEDPLSPETNVLNALQYIALGVLKLNDADTNLFISTVLGHEVQKAVKAEVGEEEYNAAVSSLNTESE